MQQIYQLLSDPGWWFTAVLIGILASLCASYIRDFFEYLLSHLSSVYRRRLEARREKRRRIIHVLANESTLHIVVGLLLLTFTVMFATLILLYVTFPVYLRARYFTDLPLAPRDVSRLNDTLALAGIVIGLLGICAAYFEGMLWRVFIGATLLRIKILKESSQTSLAQDADPKEAEPVSDGVS